MGSSKLFSNKSCRLQPRQISLFILKRSGTLKLALFVFLPCRVPRLSREDQKKAILRLERMVAGGYDDILCDPSDGSAGSTSEACQGNMPEEGGAILTRSKDTTIIVRTLSM